MEPVDGKILSQYDVGDATERALSDKIKQVAGGTQAELSLVNGMRRKVKWCEVKKTDDFRTMQKELMRIPAKIDALQEVLNGVVGVDKQIAGLADVQKIPTFMKMLQPLECQIGLIQKRIRKLDTYCVSDHYSTAYAFLEELLTDMLHKVVESVLPQEKVVAYANQKFCEVKKSFSHLALSPAEMEPIEKKKLLASKELYLEMLYVMRHAAGQKQIEISGLDEHIAIIKEQLKAGKKPPLAFQEDDVSCSSSVASKDAELYSPGRDAVEGQSDPQSPHKDDIPSGYLDEYSFWRNTPYGTTAWLWTGHYKETAPQGEKLEKSVGQPLGALISRLEERLLALSSGDQTTFNGMTRAEEINSYIKKLVQLENLFYELRDEIGNKPYDALTPYLLKYAYGLQFALGEARGVVRLLQKFTDASAKNVFRAMDAVSSILQEHRELDECEKAFIVYQAVVQLLGASRPVHAAKSKKFVPTYFSRILGLIREVHAKKDAVLVKLTPTEAEVAHTILKGQSLGEELTALPDDVVSYLAKRMIPALFLQSDPVDIELELVLRMIKTNPPYTQLYDESINSNAMFRALAEHYEKEFEEKRIYDLEMPASIAFYLLHAAAEQSEIHSFAHGWQQLAEAPAIPIEMKKLLLEMIDKAGSTHSNTLFLPAVEEKKGSLWSINTPEVFGQELLDGSKRVRAGMDEVTLQHVFNSVLLSALAESIYATSAELRYGAHQFLERLFAHADYQGLLNAIPEGMKALICTSTLKKLERISDKLTLYERNLLHSDESPLVQFIKSPSITIEDGLVQTTLFKLMEQDEYLSSMWKQYKRAFHPRWYDDHKAFIQTETP